MILELPPSDKFKPMLAYSGEWDYTDLRFPVIATPKFDGVRCFIRQGRPWTRACKRIPNKYIREKLSGNLYLESLDGEIVLPGKSFHEIQSAVMTEEGEPDFHYVIFDMLDFERVPYTERIKLLYKSFTRGLFPEGFAVTVLAECPNWTDLSERHQEFLKLGFEGTIVRSPDGWYKQGRSTLAEQLMLKMVDWKREEGVIIGYQELMMNRDTSSKELHNMIPAGTLGALILTTKQWGEVVVGSGFTDIQRKTIWKSRMTYHGKTVTFKYKPFGMQEKPRQPIFVGLRSELDL